MSRVTARTGTTGYILVRGLDLSNLSTDKQQARAFDPWTLVSRLKPDVTKFKCFFEEDEEQDLVYKRLSPYNLLANYIARNDPDISQSDDVEYGKMNGAKVMTVRNTSYLLYACKIHRRYKGEEE